MPSYTYTTNIPFSTNNPSNDQPNMQTNTNSIASLIAQDHIGFNVNNGGWHTLIHQQPYSTTASNPPNNNPPTLPGPAGGFGEIVTVQMTIGGITDEVLYYIGGGGRYTQLTSILTAGAGNQTSAVADGYTVLSGGIILQWGFVTFPTIGGPFTHIANAQNFPIKFPTACFSVTGTLYCNNSSTATNQNTLAILNFNQTAVNYLFNSGDSNSGRYTGFYFSAIGN